MTIDREWGDGWSLVSLNIRIGRWTFSIVFDVSRQAAR